MSEDLVSRTVRAGQALAEQGRWAEADARFRDAAASLEDPEDAMTPALLALARAQVVGAHPPLRGAVVDDLERALTTFQQEGNAELFLQGLGLATRLHLLLLRRETVLDRSRRLATSAEKLGSPGPAALARVYAGLALEMGGDLTQAEDVITQGLEFAEEAALSPAIRSAGWAALARVRARRGWRALAVEAAGRAVDAAGDSPIDLEIRAARAVVLGNDDPVEVYGALAEAVEAEPAFAAAYAEVASLVLQAADDTEAALAEVESAMARLRAAGREDLATGLLAASARLLTRQGRRNRALAALDAAAAAPAWVNDALAVLKGQLLFELGRVAEAAIVVESAVAALANRGFDGEAVLGHLLAARCFRIGGRIGEATGHVERAGSLATGLGNAPIEALVVLERTALARARGDVEVGLAGAARALELATAAGDDRLVVQAHTLHAQLLLDADRSDEALAELEGVDPLLERVGAPALQVRHALAWHRAGAALGIDAAKLSMRLHGAAALAGEAGLLPEKDEIERLLGGLAVDEA